MKIQFGILSLLLFNASVSSSQDMGWAWAKQFGVVPGQYTQSNAIASDNKGAVYITGVAVGNLDIFIAKYDSFGNMLWIKWPGRGIGKAIATDESNNIYITGHFADSLVFGNTVIHRPLVFGGDLFVVKLDSAGNLIWIYFGGEDYLENGTGITVDDSGNVIVVGEFQSATMTFGNTTLINHGPQGTSDSFVVKFNASGNIIWAKCAGGRAEDVVRGVTTDRFGNVISTGEFHSAEMNFNGIKIINSNTGENWKASDIFLSKYSPSGNLIWAINEGEKGENQDGALDVIDDSNGNIYITGYYTGPFLSIGNDVLTNANTNATYAPASGEFFIAKYDPSGKPLWARGATLSDGPDEGIGIEIDAEDNIYVGGFFGNGSDEIRFDEITLDIFEQGLFQSFIVKYNPDGEVLWATCSQGGHAESTGFALNKFGDAFITGIFEHSVKFGNTILSTQEDSFVAKLSSCNNFTHPKVEVDGLLTICYGDTTTLSSTVAWAYLWSTGQSSSSIKVNQTGNYFVTSTDITGCRYTSESVHVNVVNLQPHITSSADFICTGSQTTLSSDLSDTYLWSTGEVTQSITVEKPGQYHVTIKDANGCTVISPEIQIQAKPTLANVLLQQDCHKVFTVSEVPLKWYKDNELLFAEPVNSKEIQPTDSGYYFVETSNECETIHSNIIHFIPSELNFIYQTNVITPNGDEHNEFFVLDNKLSGSALTIINRWGTEVYYSAAYKNNWNGDNLSEGTYYYVIHHPCFDQDIKGVISIER